MDDNPLLTGTRTVGFYAKIWWMDALGGLLLSVIVIFNWSHTSLEHIKNLSGFSATADERNIRTFSDTSLLCWKKDHC